MPFLRVVATLATGYWLNDFGTWLSTTLGLKPTQTLDNRGNLKWWYVLLVAGVIAGAIALVFMFLSKLIPGIRRKRR